MVSHSSLLGNDPRYVTDDGSSYIRRSVREADAPSHQNACPKGLSSGALCEPAPPTVVILVSGLCVVTFLLAIVIMLLCVSHFRRTRNEPIADQGEEQGRTSTETGQALVSRCNSLVLVILPGEDKPSIFARPTPMPKDEVEVATDPAIENCNLPDESKVSSLAAIDGELPASFEGEISTSAMLQQTD